MNVPPEHPLYDLEATLNNAKKSHPPGCPYSLCIRRERDLNSCDHCTEGWKPPEALAAHARKGWGGRRSGAGAPKGSFNHLKTGCRSALIRRAVEVLAEHKELRPFLLLLARAAIEGEIPQTTRRLILATLGEKTAGMQAATIQLRRLKDA